MSRRGGLDSLRCLCGYLLPSEHVLHLCRKSPGHTAAAAPRLRDRGCNGERRAVRQRNLGYRDKQESSAAQGCQLGHVGLEGAIITANLPRGRASSVSQLPTRSEGAACVIPSLPAEETWGPFRYCLLQALAEGRWEEANYTEGRNCVFRPWGWGSARATPREGIGEPGSLCGARSWRRACWTPPVETQLSSASPSRGRALAAAPCWQLDGGGLELGREARSTCSLPRRTFHLRCHEICRYSASPAPVSSSSALPAETNWELLSREGSFGRLLLEGCSKRAGKQPGSKQRDENGPSLWAVLSCKHSEALLPVDGFTT